MTETGACIVMTTLPSKADANRLVELVLVARLAACVQAQPILSSYWWQEKITSDEEYLLLIKTSVVKYDALEQTILAAHPYAVPEVIRIPIEAGSGAYLAWIQSVTGASTKKPDGM